MKYFVEYLIGQLPGGHSKESFVAKLKILVIDDSMTVIAWLQQVLSKAGFEVCSRTVAIGSGAAILREQPDLVLMDINMPALQGDEVIRDFRRSKHGKEVRIVVHSSLPIDELAQIVDMCEADGYIQKTNNAQEFIRQIKRFLLDSSTPTESANATKSQHVLVVSNNPLLTATTKIIVSDYPNIEIIQAKDDLEAVSLLKTRLTLVLVIIELHDTGPTTECKIVTRLLNTHTILPMILIGKGEPQIDITERPSTLFIRADPLRRADLRSAIKTLLPASNKVGS